MKKIYEKLCILILMFSPLYVYAFDDILRNAVEWISGPLGLVIGMLGLGISAIGYIFAGSQYMGKMLASLIGSLVLLSLPSILRTIESFSR